MNPIYEGLNSSSTYVDGNLWKDKFLLQNYLLMMIQYGWSFYYSVLLLNYIWMLAILYKLSVIVKAY